MAVDLHAHSTYSDGSDTPTELVMRAARAGLSAVALTDHDTLEGIEEASAAAGDASIELVPGTEISCEWDQGTMHMVVLFLESGRGPLPGRLGELQRGRDGRNSAIVRKLHDLGIDLTLSEVEAEAGEGSVGRPHIAAVLVRKGIVPDIRSAFDEYLAAGGPAYVDRLRLQPEEAIDLALRSGGLPIIAHPHTLGLDSAEEYGSLFSRLSATGLVGIECNYGDYTKEERRQFSSMAREFGLVPSGGSDYHGTYKEGIDLGVGRGDLVVPDHVLDELKAARETIGAS